MSCQIYEDRLSEYIDLALPQAEQKDVAVHLEKCRNCAGVYEDLLSIYQVSRQIPEVEPPDRVWRHIEAALLNEGVPSRESWTSSGAGGSGVFRLSSFQRATFLIAATLIAAIGMISIYQKMVSRRSAPSEVGRTAEGTNDIWTGPSTGKADLQPVNLLVVHKPNIETSIVEQRIEQLERQIQARQTQWDPQIHRVFDTNLDRVNHNLEHGREDLQIHRDDPAAREIYRAALLAKVEMLKQFAEL